MSSILVIGGNSDIGYATAKVFAQNKYNIHLVSRNTSQLEIKKKEIENLYKVKCKITFLDILNEENVNNFLKKYKESCFSKGMLDSEDLNGAIIFLLSKSSKYINGQNIIIDDGWSI